MTALTAPTAGPVGTHTPPVTTAALAAFMRTDDTTGLQTVTTSAIAVVEDACGPITPGQWLYPILQTPLGRSLRLPRWPTSRLDTVDALADPTGTDAFPGLTVGSIDWANAVVTPPTLIPGYWRVTATRSRLPAHQERLIEATLIIGKHLWETQRGGAARPSTYGQSPGDQPAMEELPARAQMLMRPCLRTQGA